MAQVQQTFEFIESINDALGAAVRALGGPKKVGPMLKPEKTVHDASGWVTDCLNPDREAFFHPEHVQFLLREAGKVGFHGSMDFVCGDGGYAKPVPINPEDEKDRIQREFIESVKQQTRNIERMERLSRATIPATA